MGTLGDLDQVRDTGRIEAFSDGVIAIIITIMVLEIHAPKAASWTALIALWPTLLAYILSFMYVAIYWMNHNRLIGLSSTYSVRLGWANMALLFVLSLVPISTAWLGEFPLSTIPTATYLTTLVLPSIVWLWFDAEVMRLAEQPAHPVMVTTERIKQISSVILYSSGIALAFMIPMLSLVCAALVSAIWVFPDGPIDKLLTRAVAQSHK